MSRIRSIAYRVCEFGVVQTFRLLGMRDEAALFEHVFKLVRDPKTDWRDVKPL